MKKCDRMQSLTAGIFFKDVFPQSWKHLFASHHSRSHLCGSERGSNHVTRTLGARSAARAIANSSNADLAAELHMISNPYGQPRMKEKRRILNRGRWV